MAQQPSAKDKVNLNAAAAVRLPKRQAAIVRDAVAVDVILGQVDVAQVLDVALNQLRNFIVVALKNP